MTLEQAKSQLAARALACLTVASEVSAGEAVAPPGGVELLRHEAGIYERVLEILDEVTS